MNEKRWPFAETPGEFTARLETAIGVFGNLLGAVRNVLIENPPTLVAGLPEIMELNAWRSALQGLCQGPSETFSTPEKAAENVRRRLRPIGLAAAAAPEQDGASKEFTYATSGPRLELDAMLAKLVAAVYTACEAAIDSDGPLPAPDDVGVEEAKAIQHFIFELIERRADVEARPLR